MIQGTVLACLKAYFESLDGSRERPYAKTAGSFRRGLHPIFKAYPEAPM